MHYRYFLPVSWLESGPRGLSNGHAINRQDEPIRIPIYIFVIPDNPAGAAVAPLSLGDAAPTIATSTALGGNSTSEPATNNP
jgi:hypothetical protein